MALINCKECGKEISSEAISCPHCGFKQITPINFKAKVKPTDFIVGAIIVAAGLWWAISSDNKPVRSNPVSPPQLSTPKPIIIVNAQELYAAYESNEVATDEKIKGYIVRITGNVDSIDKDFTDSISIKLRTSNQFSSVNISLPDSEKPRAMALKHGEKATFDCESFHRIMGSPMGSECKFSSQK